MCIIPQGGPPPTGDPHGTLWLPAGGGSRSRQCRMKPKDSHGNPRDPKRTQNPSSSKTILGQTTTNVPSTLFSSTAAVTLLFTIFILLLLMRLRGGPGQPCQTYRLLTNAAHVTYFGSIGIKQLMWQGGLYVSLCVDSGNLLTKCEKWGCHIKWIGGFANWSPRPTVSNLQSELFWLNWNQTTYASGWSLTLCRL